MRSVPSIFILLLVTWSGCVHRSDNEPSTLQRESAEAELQEAPLPPPAPRARIIRQELREAERTVTQRHNILEDARRDVADLTEERDRWSKELHYAQTKLVNAETQLGHYDDPSQKIRYAEEETSKETERWQREVSGWTARVEQAEAELEAIDAQLIEARALVQAMQRGEMPDDLLVAGDALDLVVLEDETLNGIYPVRRGGYVILPRVGRVSVAGKELPAAETAIREALQENQIREATVVVERSRVSTLGSEPVVFLTGEFEKPGPWEIKPDTAPTLVTTILQSGGLTELADLSRVRLLRLVKGEQLAEEFNVQSMLEGLDLAADVPVHPGDIVVVPIAPNLVYVTGNVTQPGPLLLSPAEELKAYSAILRSGGFARFANRKKVYVLRDVGDEAKQRIDINITEIQKGNVPDVVLQNNDIIVVPERFFSF